MAVIPNAPASVTAEKVAQLFNVEATTAAEVLQLAVTTLNRELAGAFRDMSQEVYDDLIRRIAGGIVGSRKRPAGGNGQLTRTDQAQPASSAPAGPRDYLAPARQTLALYVAPL